MQLLDELQSDFHFNNYRRDYSSIADKLEFSENYQKPWVKTACKIGLVASEVKALIHILTANLEKQKRKDEKLSYK
jgi:hypothetical protein